MGRIIEISYDAIYKDICHASDPQDLEETINRFKGEKAGSVVRMADEVLTKIDFQAYSPGSPIFYRIPSRHSFLGAMSSLSNSLFEWWLRAGNCPPPRTPQTGIEVTRTSSVSDANNTPVVDSDDMDPKNFTKEFLFKNWKTFAIVGGLMAITWTLVGVSVFLAADDVTGVGTLDDPLLAVTIPAATATAARAAMLMAA